MIRSSCSLFVCLKSKSGKTRCGEGSWSWQSENPLSKVVQFPWQVLYRALTVRWR